MTRDSGRASGGSNCSTTLTPRAKATGCNRRRQSSADAVRASGCSIGIGSGSGPYRNAGAHWASFVLRTALGPQRTAGPGSLG